MANYHYDEAGNMAAYFLISFLTVVLIPLTLTLSPTSKDQSPNGCQCRSCVVHRQEVRKREQGTFLRPRLSARTILIISGWVILAVVAVKAARAKVDNKIYNPFEILGLRTGVPEKMIKAHFKNLSRIYHPDKVKLSINETTESVANRFVEITKAYKSLTDENIRKNWELYGHPDGRQEMSMGIALPRWIVEGRNNIWVLSFYALAFGGALPLLVGRWWFGSRQKTKDGINGRTATVIFKALQEDSGTDEILGTLGRSFRWEQQTPNSRPPSDLRDIESQIQTQLGHRWSGILKMADMDGERGDRRALILLFSHLLRVPVHNQSLRNEQSRLLVNLPQLLNALLTVSASRSWLLPTLSIMRLHAYLAQAVMPGDNAPRLAQLPGIQASDLKEMELQVSELEDFVEILDARGDNRVGDIRKAVETWGRLELVDASFKVIGERIFTPSAIVFLVVKLRVSPPLDDRISESASNTKDGMMEVNEEIDNKFLTGRNDAEDLPEASLRHGWAHAPYWPTNRKAGWWLVLADEKTNRVVVPPTKLTDVPLSKPNAGRNFRSYKMQFQAPPNTGLFTWKVYLISDTFIGEDVGSEITLKIEDLAALGPDAQWEEDEISEPDEDSLAGQMALMKGGAMKRDEDSNDESSSDGDESDNDSDSD